MFLTVVNKCTKMVPGQIIKIIFQQNQYFTLTTTYAAHLKIKQDKIFNYSTP